MSIARIMLAELFLIVRSIFNSPDVKPINQPTNQPIFSFLPPPAFPLTISQLRLSCSAT